MAEWCDIEQEKGAAVLYVRGSWRIRNLSLIWDKLSSCSNTKGTNWIVDGSGLREIDTAGVMVLVRLFDQLGVSIKGVELRGFSKEHFDVLDLAVSKLNDIKPTSKPAVICCVQDIGQKATELFATVKLILAFVGETASEIVRVMFNPWRIRYKELFVQLQTAAFDAVPVVALVTFLIGVVIAYLSGVQIARYGANIFIVDGVSLAMCRELSPILVAVIVAGRSGSAFTAQIGAMKLNEETDAMTAMGLSIMRVIVIPRLLALMIAMPILVFIGDVSGIIGGMVVADFRLGITGATFIERLRNVLWVRSVLVGIIKAPIFGLFVATIGCQTGLMSENNARSVGMNTTRTVVRSIVAVILLDAAFAVVFSELGI